MPQLKDPYFSKTLTLLAEFNKEGAMGVILNRPLAVSLTHIMGEEIKESQKPPTQLFWGGPVQNDRGWVLHEDDEYADESTEIEPGLYLTASSNVLQKLIDKAQTPNAPRYRFFLGYAGWDAGQLEHEMAASSWVTSPIHRELLFDDDSETLWERSLARMGVDPMSLATSPHEEAN